MTARTETSMADVAAEAVRQLDNDGVPPLLPEHDIRWNETFVRAIRRHKEQFRGSKDLRNLLRITGELLYGKEIHWAMELVQNAEDAGARRIAFVFEPDRVLVWNDGAPFDARDVWAICSAGHSPKRNKIGFFGIGFKSVYRLSATPEIYSGPYALRIEDKLYPNPLAARRLTGSGAWFVLPLIADQRPNIQRVVSSLVSKDFAQVLLSLVSLTEIRVMDRTGAGLSGRFWRTPIRSDAASGWDECEIGGSWNWATARTWRRFIHETAAVPSGIQREGRTVEPGDRSVVVLARPVDDEPAELRLHCFLPTAVSSQLCWLVQADFEPSASREQLRQSSWNEWLMGEVGLALAEAIRVSARTLALAPWNLVPLEAEVDDPQQRIAYNAAISSLHDTTFVATRRGWRRPIDATWALYPGVDDVVREGDLVAATGRDVSYVRAQILGPISASASSRAEEVLGELGAVAIDCDELITLFGAEDAVFRRVRRDGTWWIQALGLMASHGTEDQKAALAETPCLPVRDGARVRPSPAVDADGHMVAFSRSDLSADLREYLGESQVHLVEPFLSPQSRRRGRRSGDMTTDITDIIEMLEAEPFNVAPKAGPYHVVSTLVIPRLNALAQEASLEPMQVERAWRLLEYVRQKWPTYVSEYRRRRSVRATEAAIAGELGLRLSVVARVGRRRSQVLRLRPVTETYVSSEMLGWDGMETVLADDASLAVIDAIHAKPLRVTIKRRGGRSRSAAPAALDFLRLLGAPIGPRVAPKPPTQVAPHDIPWVDWSQLPTGARGRVSLSGDWDSSDVSRLATRWPALSQRDRARRGEALLRSIEADWVRLQPTTTALARYFYSTWTYYAATASTWVGRVRDMAWLPSLAGTLERPTHLSVDTQANRLVLGDATDEVLKWRISEPEAIARLGVQERPGVEQVIDTLGALRVSQDLVTRRDAVEIARACYVTLADHLRASEPNGDEVRRLIATRMRGGGGRGLIYAPPPEGVDGEQWWPPSRVVQNDVQKWAGPYLGQLAGRYRAASLLWDSLGIHRDLTPGLVCEVIARDLVHDSEVSRASEYYGRLVAFLQGSRLDGIAPATPALTSGGWQPAASAWWSDRAEVIDALATSVAWWQPGDRDPTSLRDAAAYLGVRQASIADGGPLSERWTVGEPEPLEMERDERWRLAVRTWPYVLRRDGDPAQWEMLRRLDGAAEALRPVVAQGLRIHFALATASGVVRASIQPSIALRQRDGVIVGASSDELFSPRAADVIATLLESDQRRASHELALLLSLAAHDPEELALRAAHHSVVAYQHREFSFQPADFDELEQKGDVGAKLHARRKTTRSDAKKPEPFIPLADPTQYGLISLVPSSGSGSAPEPLVAGKLKPPVTDEDDSLQGANGDAKRPPSPQPRYSNIDIEGAARPFIEEYELSSRDCTVIRQGPNIGADYVASDGRYIEVKAFSREAPDSFELEAPEWRAAQHPEVAERYWVYVVEHLRDGTPPRITAIFNPILDNSTSKEPTGKLRVRGWKHARLKQLGQFGERPSDLRGPEA